MVDFKIMQRYHAHEWPADVGRTDCCHGEVHYHQFYEVGTGDDRTVIEVIPKEDSWACVDRNFYRCKDLVIDNFLANYRRWRA